MKRPLCTVGFTLLFTLLCLNQFSGRAFEVWLLGCSAVLFVLSLLIEKTRKNPIIPTVLITVSVACMLFTYAENSYRNTVSLCSENAKVVAVVAENPEFSKDNGRYYCVMNLSEIDGKKAKGRIRLSLSETYDEISHHSFEIGDRISFTGTVYETGKDVRSVQNYFKSQKIYVGAYGAENLTIEKPRVRGIYYYAALLREKAVDVILRHFNGDTAGLMIAVLTGDKSYISDEFYTASKLAGVVHLMAVSGLHLSVWVFFVGALLERKGKKSKLAYTVMMLCVIFMMNFASLTGSVRRAGFMTLLYLFGKIISKDSDPLNSLGFALAVILFVSPYSVFDVGFLLSLFSTLGILVMAFPLSDRIFKRLRIRYEDAKLYRLVVYIAESVLVSISVTVFTFPVMYTYFGYISSVSVITNLLILFVCMPLVVLTGVFVLTSTVPVFSAVVGILCKYISLYIVNTVLYMGSLPFAKISLDYDFLGWWTVLFCVVLFLSVATGKIKAKFKATLCLVLTLTFAVGFCAESYINHGSYKLTNLSSTGNCVLISSGGRSVLVGMSGDYYLESTVTNAVEKKDVSLDAIIPDENADRLALSYVADRFGAKVVESDCAISLFGKVNVVKSGGKVTAEGNGKSILVLNEECLQEKENYDIIISTSDYSEIIIRKKR